MDDRPSTMASIVMGSKEKETIVYRQWSMVIFRTSNFKY